MADATTSSNDTPVLKVKNYEIKCLLDSTKVLDSQHELHSTVKDAFVVQSSSEKMDIQYLDTQDKQLNQAEWNVRIRKMQGKTGLELTYKKRYSVNKDLDNPIDQALAAASQDGFDLKEDGFEAQVDWGYKNQTLSLQRTEVDTGVAASSAGLPDIDTSQSITIEEAPDRFETDLGAQVSKDVLGKSKIYGPVFAERFSGSWDDDDLDIEVWPIKNSTNTGLEYIVEVSFKAKKFDKAGKKRKALQDFLEKKDWLLKRDSLKTSLILERY